MNILQTQDHLKNFSAEQLAGELQNPSGIPPFLTLSEQNRRNRMKTEYAAASNSQAGEETTVSEDVTAAAGVPQQGIAQIAQNMAPNTNIAQNTGVTKMKDGGRVPGFTRSPYPPD